MPKLALFPTAPSPVDLEWLLEWLRLSRLSVLSNDLPQIPEPCERDLAALILQRILSGNPLDFRYFGGSEPGKLRRVLPVQLFTTAMADMANGIGGHNPLYLLTWG